MMLVSGSKIVNVSKANFIIVTILNRNTSKNRNSDVIRTIAVFDNSSVELDYAVNLEELQNEINVGLQILKEEIVKQVRDQIALATESRGTLYYDVIVNTAILRTKEILKNKAVSCSSA